MQLLLRAEQFCATESKGEGLNLTLMAGARVGILGDSGSGKTALLRALARLQPSTQGRLWWGETEVTRKARWLLGKRRTFAALVSANPYTLFAPWSAMRRLFTTAQRASLAERFRDGGMPPLPVAQAVRTLSGVERVRLALLWTLQNDPQVLLVDDVFRWVLPEMWRPLVDELDARAGKARAVISASRFWQALQTTAYVIVLENGIPVEAGPRVEVFAHPQHSCTRRLLGQTQMDDKNLTRS